MYSTHNLLLLKYLLEIYKHMTAVSKNVYFDVIGDIAHEYNNTYHRTIKKKSMLSITFLLNIMKDLMRKILNLK